MDEEKLVHMANQIAQFFQSYSAEEAAQGVAEHLKAFWTPGMCRRLAARCDWSPDGVEPSVLRALKLPELTGADLPAEATSPIAKTVKGPNHLGELASDAG